MPSFDVVSCVKMNEVVNAVDQVRREILSRYDLKGTKCKVEFNEKDGLVELLADDDMKLGALQELLRLRLAKRGVSPKLAEFKEAQSAAGDMKRQEVLVKQGLTEDELKRLNKIIKQAKIKVTSQIQEKQLRVSGKKRDDLQEIMALLKKETQDLDLQFINFRD